MIGIICAMPEEVEGFLRGIDGAATRRDGFTRARIGDFDAVIADSGLGKVRAAMTASILLERWRCRGLVSAGTAGGLDGAQPMQVIVGTELVQHDYGRSRGTGLIELYRPGVPPLPENLDPDIALGIPAARRAQYEAATRGLDYVRFGRYASGDTFVNDADTRRRLVDLGATAVDMESSAVAQVAEHYAVPWLVAKGISDDASASSHEDFVNGLTEASHRSAVIVGKLLPPTFG